MNESQQEFYSSDQERWFNQELKEMNSQLKAISKQSIDHAIKAVDAILNKEKHTL